MQVLSCIDEDNLGKLFQNMLKLKCLGLSLRSAQWCLLISSYTMYTLQGYPGISHDKNSILEYPKTTFSFQAQEGPVHV